jgi:hypothetical protein
LLARVRGRVEESGRGRDLRRVYRSRSGQIPHNRIDVQLGKTTVNLETKNIAFPAPRSGDREYAGFRSVVRSAR